MEVVTLLRMLWRHRLLVLVAGLLGCLVGLSMAYRVSFPPKLQSRQYTVGVASAMALVDTHSSQVVDLGGTTGTDIATLAARASLLANLMTSSPIKDEIASRAGIPPNKLIAVQPAAGGAPGTPQVSGATISPTDPKANILKASIPTMQSGVTPIIAVSTQAPDAKEAARLANEAVAALKAHLQAIAGMDRVPDVRRVVVTQLGAAQSATETSGPSRTLALLVAVVVLGLGCACIVGTAWLVGGWRRAEEMERLQEEEPAWLADDEEDDFDEPPLEASNGRSTDDERYLFDASADDDAMFDVLDELPVPPVDDDTDERPPRRIDVVG